MYNLKMCWVRNPKEKKQPVLSNFNKNKADLALNFVFPSSNLTKAYNGTYYLTELTFSQFYAAPERKWSQY